MNTISDDPINPKHYTQYGYQAIELISDMGLKDAYFLGSVLKYVSRCRLKNGKEDLQKALYFFAKGFAAPKKESEYIFKFINQLRKPEDDIILATFNNDHEKAKMLLNEFINDYDEVVNSPQSDDLSF